MTNSTHTQNNQVISWDYQTNQGETKTAFRQDFPDKPKKCWQSTNKIEGQPYPLYFDKVPDDPVDPILVVEGEKCADWFTKQTNIFATTNIAGSQNCHLTDWTPLENKDVVLWRDNDQAGQAWEQNLGKILIDLGCSVSVIPIPRGMPDKWDCYGLSRKELIDCFSKSKPFKKKLVIGQPKHLEVIKGGVDLGMTIKAKNKDFENKSRFPSYRSRAILSDQEQFEVLKKLPKAEMKRGGYWMACCPAHDDHNPSLSFSFKDGKLEGPKCWSQKCTFESILKAAGVKNQKQPKKSTSKKAKKKAITGEVEFRTYADIEPEAVEWLVHDWIALGEICIFAGAPGMGKTTLATMLASIVSSGGGKWGDGSIVKGGKVLFYASEASVPKKNVPNVYANGGNPSNILEAILAPNPEPEEGEEDKIEFDPAIHLPVLNKTLEKYPDVKLIIFDPIVDVSANAKDEHRASDIRKALKPLQKLAKERNLAVLGITHFLKRHNSKGSSIMDRVHGSGAWMRVAQQGWAVEESADLGKFLMKFKNNVGSEEGGFRYSWEPEIIKVKDKPPATGIKVLSGDYIKGRMEDIVATSSKFSDPDKDDPIKKTQLEECKEYLRDWFTENSNPQKWDFIVKQANKEGLTKRTLGRARSELLEEGFIQKSKDKDGWLWSLSPQKQ